MKPPSKSPQRHTFQKEGYLKRCQENGEEPNPDYLELFQKILENDDRKFNDPASRKNNLEWDLVTTDWVLEKVRASESYAQNIYAALCNNEFVRKEMWPLLRMDPNKDLWGCSWRYAGGIVADMRQEGDYIDWYCSGIRGDGDSSDSEYDKFVPEGKITREIAEDLNKLGWIPAPGGDWEQFD
jgi:hypothetical protein